MVESICIRTTDGESGTQELPERVDSSRAGSSYDPKAPIKIGKEKRMKDPYDEGIANRIGPESCVGDREVAAKR